MCWFLNASPFLTTQEQTFTDDTEGDRFQPSSPSDSSRSGASDPDEAMLSSEIEEMATQHFQNIPPSLKSGSNPSSSAHNDSDSACSPLAPKVREKSLSPESAGSLYSPNGDLDHSSSASDIPLQRGNQLGSRKNAHEAAESERSWSSWDGINGDFNPDNRSDDSRSWSSWYGINGDFNPENGSDNSNHKANTVTDSYAHLPPARGKQVRAPRQARTKGPGLAAQRKTAHLKFLDNRFGSEPLIQEIQAGRKTVGLPVQTMVTQARRIYQLMKVRRPSDDQGDVVIPPGIAYFSSVHGSLLIDFITLRFCL